MARRVAQSHRRLAAEGRAVSGLAEIVARLDAGERAVLMQLSHNRPTEDGDIIGKAQRDRLIKLGLAHRSYGMTTLTRDGVAAQVLAGELA